MLRFPFHDLTALEKALATRQMAAFIVEPLQGKIVSAPDDEYLAGAQVLGKKYGTLFIADELNRARPYRSFSSDRSLGRRARHGSHLQNALRRTRSRGGGPRAEGDLEKVFDRMDRAVVHGSTFAMNDLAMAAGIATLEILNRNG